MSHEFETMFELANESDVSITHAVNIEHGEIQLSKMQDFAASGSARDNETNEPFQWAVVCDGHGTNAVIEMVRQQIGLAVVQAEPCTALQSSVCATKKLGYESSGCTAIITKIYKDRCLIQSVGDSTVIVMKDGEPVWKNTLHNWDNLEERGRLREKNPLNNAIPTKCTRVLSPETMCYMPSWYVTFFGYVQHLAMTQAIGHDNMTGIAPSTYEFVIEPGHEYKVMAFSDGVGDMLIEGNVDEMSAICKMTANEILQFAESRWRQSWHPVSLDRPAIKYPAFRFTERAQFDDVSCFVAKIEPLV